MYSVFIAYHGTLGEEGTERTAQSLCQALTTINSPYNPYCGPSTDENTFEDHMTNVIPYSQLFILVINDFCPQINGRINQEKKSGGAGYLCEEIKAFRNLIKRHTRNVKDFAVYYCGNKRKSYDEILSYIRTLLEPIDPDNTLYTGNDHYLIELKDLYRWVNQRCGSIEADTIFSDEYAPFEPLENKVKEMVEINNHGAILLEMKRGMGKTRFIKHINRELYPNNSLAIYFSRDQGYLSLGRFRSDFVSQLKEHLKGREEPVFLDDYGELNKENFAKYLNDFKKAIFGNESLVICLDSIDDCKMNSQNRSVLDLFNDLSLFDDGIVFLFTSKIPEQGDYPKLIKDFFSIFKGERITVDENNVQYLNFLYFYYSDHILAKFDSNKIIEINPRSLFKQVKPKDMLSFSILFRVANLYLSTNTNSDPKIIASIEEALKFYYNFLKENTKKPLNYNDFITSLVILSLSDRPLNKDELDMTACQLLNKKVSQTFINNTSALSILVNTKYSKDELPKYEIRHEKLKEMIENENETYLIRSALFDNIEFKLDLLENSNLSLLEFVSENLSITYLLKSYIRNKKDNETILKYFKMIVKHLSHLNWGDKTYFILQEQDVLSTIVNNNNFQYLDTISQVKFLTRIAIDEMLLSWNSDSRTHFKKAYSIWNELNKETLKDEDLYFYFDFLTSFGNCVVRTDDELDPVEIFKAATDVSRILKDHGVLPLRDFSNNLLSYGNMLTIIRKDFANDKKTIDEAQELLENSLDPMDLGQLGWLHQRKSFWYECQGLFEESKKELKDCIDAYEYAYSKAPRSFYFGNLIVAYSAHIRDYAEEKSYQEVKDYINEIENTLFIKAKKLDFFSPREEAIFYHVLGDVYLSYNQKNEALIAYNKTISILSSAEKSTGIVDNISKHKNEIIEKINKILVTE